MAPNLAPLYLVGQAQLNDRDLALLQNTDMAKSGASKLTCEQKADQERLFQLVEGNKGIQAKVAAEAGVTPGAVNQVVKGYRPLNLSMAAAFAKVLGVKIDTISPTLAERAREIGHLLMDAPPAPPAGPWPFPEVTPEDWGDVPAIVKNPIIKAATEAVKESKVSVSRGHRQANGKS